MSNWRDSKPFLVITTAATAVLATLSFAYGYIIPVYEKQDENKIYELNSKINRIEKENNSTISSLKNTIEKQKLNIEKLQGDITDLTSKLNSNKTELLMLSTLSSYQHGQPLPIGYSSILPGMPLDDVKNTYEKSKLEIDPKNRFVTVKVDRGGISDITYIAGVEEAPGIITDITVNKYDIKTSSDGSEDSKEVSPSLLALLQENLGKKSPCGDGQYIWPINDHSYLYYNEELSFMYKIFFNQFYYPGTSSKCLNELRSIWKDANKKAETPKIK
ncbi:TPA: hypothetical protein I4D82_08925 [Enterobacter cloacae]|nr:hypothetical protein [Enterobacter cloacae]